MQGLGYFQHPTIHENSIIFQSDDDLWRLDLNERAYAYKITSGRGAMTSPHFSPNGKLVAFIATDLGQKNVYLMDSYGGEYAKVSNLFWPTILGWKNEKTLIVSSSHEHFTARERLIYELNIESLDLKRIDVGPAAAYAQNKTGEILLGRNNGDPARWKRYRGGTAGTIWTSQAKSKGGRFKQILKSIKGNLASPKWWNNRILFISDHEGIGNIYSCTKDGRSIKRVTHHQDFYVRNFSIHGDRICYQCGADLYLYDLSTGVDQLVEFEFKTTAIQGQERFENAYNYLQEYIINENADKLALTIRGQIHIIPPWGGAPVKLGKDNVRYKSPLWLKVEKSQKGKKKKKKEFETKLLAIRLENNTEGLSLFNLENMQEEEITLKEDWGIISDLSLSPDKKHICVVNNRNQIFSLDLKKRKLSLIDEGKSWPIAFSDVAWSPDSNYLVYPKPLKQGTEALMVYNFKKKELRQLITPVLGDGSPCFSPDGKYLYFHSMREFHPVECETHYELSFPSASKVYALCLEPSTPPPMERYLNFEEEDDEDHDDEDSTEETIIDFNGIENRIYALDLPMGGYIETKATDEKLFILKKEAQTISPLMSAMETTISALYTFDFKTKKFEKFHDDTHSFMLTDNGKYLLLESDDLRLVQTSSKPSDDQGYDKKNGWVDIQRINIKICPRKEWRQMYQEAWLLQREHFWTPDMSKIDWEKIYKRYLPLLSKVNTRLEFSDLIWEMQGELGTSHCYEFSGDYNRRPPQFPNGHLGASFKFQRKDNSFEITSIHHGDSWNPFFSSPLAVSGVDLKVGDKIYAIDGEAFTNSQSLNFSLEGKPKTRITLYIKRKNKRTFENVIVETIPNPTLPLYRQWVNKNKEYVHKKTKGKIGYVHVPDMGIFGYSEFFRNYLSESNREGLIVDVRYNGGGSVSQLIFKMLNQQVIGFNTTRWYGHDNYPRNAVNGPMVCLTNEHAGSDGDIFSHSFKLKNLGKLVGKRTWGGVIGIWPRHYLNDNSLTSQPEFSFWFKDVGFNVENYGTDPDIEVEISPEDWAKEVDSQLDKSIEVVMKEHRKNPPLKPDFKKRPNLKAPKLPTE